MNLYKKPITKNGIYGNRTLRTWSAAEQKVNNIYVMTLLLLRKCIRHERIMRISPVL